MMPVLDTTLSGFLGFSVSATALMIVLALALTVIRLLRGPSMADRVVALDLISMLLVAFLVLFAATSGRQAYLDAGLALALVAFLATVAFARYIERSGQSEGNT